MRYDHKLPLRANHILNLFFLGLLLILIRVWYLTVIQKEKFSEESLLPKRRTVIEPVERATIRDRFNVPLAINKIRYQAAVSYASILQIPRAVWRWEGKKKVKTLRRLSYIQELSEMLAKELSLDPTEIEDTIHAKASLFPHTPFIIKDDLSEGEYYRLKMLERKWLGIAALRTSKRYYPWGKAGADTLGYLGAISDREYVKIANELNTLKAYVKEREAGEPTLLPKGFKTPLEVNERLNELQNKSYTINDLVGKGGIEKELDEALRGKCGKRVFEIDTQGNFLRRIPGARPPVPGRRAVLSLSIELQAFAEQLLATYECEESKKEAGGLHSPWIRGGAIVAMDPRTGEVLALASHPRLDPNDFIQKNGRVSRWLENDSLIAQIWDGALPLSRELFDAKKRVFLTEETFLSWEGYLARVLAPASSVFQALLQIDTLEGAVKLQLAAEALLKLSGQKEMRELMESLYPPHAAPKEREGNLPASLLALVDSRLFSISCNKDRLLLLDLCKLIANREDFSLDLLEEAGSLSLFAYRSFCQRAKEIKTLLREELRPLFHETTFKKWRSVHFASFLKERRKEEKERKRAPRPYMEYLIKEEQEQFLQFWKRDANAFLLAFLLPDSSSLDGPKPYPEFTGFERANDALSHPVNSGYAAVLERAHAKIKEELWRPLAEELLGLSPSLRSSFLRGLRSFEELFDPLWGRYPRLHHHGGVQTTKDLARAFYPKTGYGYGRSYAFRQSTPAGSVFKLVTGYAALCQKQRESISFEEINPLTLIDSIQWAPSKNSPSRIMGYTLDNEPIRRLYKGGLLPRGHANIGKIDLPRALEQSSNLYFSLLASDHLKHPSDLSQAASLFGHGERTGIDLPGEIKGNLPDDLQENRTGLYSAAIGQHTLVVTPLQTAMMLSALANGGDVLKPRIVNLLASVEPSGVKPSLFHLPDYPFKDPLSLVGLSFPLFTEALKAKDFPFLRIQTPEIRRTLFLPEEVRQLLFQGMQRVVSGSRGTARYSLIRSTHPLREAVQTYGEISPYLTGKTGTAEFYYKPTLDAETKASLKNHTWFAAIAFPRHVSEEGPWDHPELVVVVYLQHGETGRNAAPLAAQIVKKWREIKSGNRQVSP